MEELELPGEDEGYYTEISPFESDKVLNEIDKLQKTYESIFDAAFWDSVHGNDNGNDNGNNQNNGNGQNNNGNGNN